jgi:hypothetical protein
LLSEKQAGKFDRPEHSQPAKQEIALLMALLNKLGWQSSVIQVAGSQNPDFEVGITQANKKAR